MAVVQPASTRYTVENLGESQRVVIPSRKVWYVITSSGFAIIVWIPGSVILATILLVVLGSILGLLTLDGDGRLLSIIAAVVLLGAAAFWTYMGIFILRTFLWHLAGKEVIEVSSQSITVHRQIFRAGRSRVYLAEHIEDLRVSPPSSRFGFSNVVDIYGVNLTRGWLAFDYGAKTVRFACGLEEAEAKQLLRVIEQYYPSNGS